MEYRAPLKKNTVLAFDGMCCHIEDVIGQGTNSIVYKGWYEDHLNPELHHHVLVKELFPDHPQQKIYRAPDGSIVVEPEAQEIWQDHRQSFEIGNEIHLRLLHDHPDWMVMGGNLNSFSYHGTLYSVLGYTGGRNLKTELNKAGATLRLTVQRMTGILDGLEAFHKSGYLHLDISPGNIMLVGQGDRERIFLIDYNSAREQGSRSVGHMSRQEGFSPPEVRTGRSPDTLGYSTDLYSVAAVFYYSLMGRALTRNEILQRCPPDGRESPMLEGVPQTVRAMVSEILRKGLHAVPRKRYQSIGQMRRAFQELLDRIDCVGVTHWALWENGKKSVEELIRINPALGYLKDKKRLYPIRLGGERSETLEAYLGDLLSPDGKSGLLLAQGGMGKTTALLHTAMLQGEQYAPDKPAVCYISLNGWDKGDTHYIRRQILMGLRFKPEENTFDSALHALHKLLEQPMQTKQGEVPAVLLLLDGLNEVRGDSAPLIREINELNQMAGVRILAASRREVPELELETAYLKALDEADIRQALSRDGLMIPQRQEVLQLLRTPLILSIYIQASSSGRQLNIRSEEELMQAYLNALLEKEICQLPEDDPQRWQMEAALGYVLPAIAAETKKKGRALTQRQLLRVVKQCRKTLRSWRIQKVFPQWIGHSRDIFHNAVKTDAWYALMIHQILWQRLGMLVQDANGRYRVFHQNVGDYLARSYRVLARRSNQSGEPVNVLAWIWVVILLLSIYSNYCYHLRVRAYSMTYGYREPSLHMALSFWNIDHALQDYLEEPSGAHYQAVCDANRQAITTAMSEFPKYTDQELREISKLDGWLLATKERRPEYLMGYDKGYISDSDVIDKFTLPSVQADYVIMLSAMDVLLENHQAGLVSDQQVDALFERIHHIQQQRYELRDLLGLWFAYPAPEYVGDCAMEPENIESAIASLQELCEEFCDAFTDYPDAIQNQIRDRCDWYLFTHLWADTLKATVSTVPSGWQKPTWLSEDATYFCSDMHPVSLRVETYAYDPENPGAVVLPFAWHTICYDISREQMQMYLKELEDADVAFTVHDQDIFLQASVHFPEGHLSITWTPQQTILSLSGFDNP